MLAPAKINLMLHVTGKRPDGYHLLQSLVMFAELGDDVSLTPSQDFSLEITGEFSGVLSGENLITKAAQALAKAHHIAPRGTITLDKKLPIGAGLGGGSMDAAVALKLLAKDWKTTTALENIGAVLGSDIPACLHAAPLWMEGAGERITPLMISFDVPLLLVNPKREVATKEVYQRLTPPYAAPIALPSQFATLAELLQFLEATHNALQAPAITTQPRIGDVLNAIKSLDNCLLERMSGSGGTCFGIFSTQEACINAAHTLQTSHPDWWIHATRLKGTHG